MKKCPFCAEEIQDEAIKCRHCGESLVEKAPWYFASSSLLISFLVVGPFMLPLIWFHPTMDRTKKAAWTAVISVISAFLIWSTYKSVVKLLEYYRMMTAY